MMIVERDRKMLLFAFWRELVVVFHSGERDMEPNTVAREVPILVIFE